MKLFRSSLTLLFIIYFLLLTVYLLFSYSLTAPNLVLNSWGPYWNFQTFMWETFFNNRQLLSYSYILIILTLFLTYFFIINLLKNSKFKIQNSKFIVIYLLVIFPLLLSNNALSYDVFNYMFNAKEVILYQANPHLQIPLDFPQDDWLRFMHNTHSVAPYGYGWTILSLIPYSLGMGKFLPTWVLFRLFSLFSITLLFFSLRFLAKKLDIKLSIYNYAILFLNPLFLIEVISNSHNDLWMMAPAIAAFALVIKIQNPESRIKNILLSGILLTFSISIKMATLVLVPVWLILALNNFKFSNWNLFRILKKNLILLSSVALFIPLLTERSKQFLPWYLLWSLVWISLLITNKKTKHWVNLLLIFSFTAMFRYVPYLWYGNYEANVELWQKIITWSAIPIFLLVLAILKIYKSFEKVK